MSTELIKSGILVKTGYTVFRVWGMSVSSVYRDVYRDVD